MHFSITLEPSGHRFDCAPGDTVLSAALAAGVMLPYSCRSGVCNTCRGHVVAGDVDPGDVHPAHLSDEDRAAGFAMLCQARPKSDLVVKVRELDVSEVVHTKSLPTRVLALERKSDDVMLVKLGVPANEPVVFLPGQYLDVTLPGGETRSYSMANASTLDGVRQLELHIRHLKGGLFTDALFEKAKVRDLWRIQVPLGSFYLRERSDKPIVMLASGTGFAPIKALVEHSLNKRMKREIVVYWGGRIRRDLYLAELAESWAAEHPHVRFVPVLSDATPECAWTGRTGFVHRAVLDDFGDLSGHQVYACGAPIVVDSARRDFTALRGLPPEEFFADSFITAAERAAVAA